MGLEREGKFGVVGAWSGRCQCSRLKSSRPFKCDSALQKIPLSKQPSKRNPNLKMKTSLEILNTALSLQEMESDGWFLILHIVLETCTIQSMHKFNMSFIFQFYILGLTSWIRTNALIEGLKFENPWKWNLYEGFDLRTLAGVISPSDAFMWWPDDLQSLPHLTTTFLYRQFDILNSKTSLDESLGTGVDERWSSLRTPRQQVTYHKLWLRMQKQQPSPKSLWPFPQKSLRQVVTLYMTGDDEHEH